MKAPLTIALVIALAGAAQAQDSTVKSLPTLVVAPLDGDVSAILGWQPALGEGLAEMLITELNRLKKFQILESTGMKDLINEIQLGEAGYVGQQEKVEKGGFAGADFLFKGKVTRFGSATKNVGLGGFVPGSLGNLGVKMTTAEVRIDWRFVDVYTRKVLHTGSATANQKGGGFDIGVGVSGHGGRIGFGNQEFMNSALGKATAKAVTNITTELVGISLPESGRRQSKAEAAGQQQQAAQAAAEALRQTPGKVLAVASKSAVIVSLGSKHGFKNGDKLNLYETVDTKDDQGNVVFTEEKLVGEVTLDAVQEERSKASYSGNLEVKTGWIVKVK